MIGNFIPVYRALARSWAGAPAEVEQYIVGRKNKYYAFIYYLTQILRPCLIVELGTNRGASAQHFKAGYPLAEVYTIDKKQMHRKSLEPDIKVLEGDSRSSKILNQIPNEIDILFIDSEHQKAVAERELNLYLPKMKEGGLVLMDDIFLNEGMITLWNSIMAEKLELTLLHEGAGFGIFIYNGETDERNSQKIA